MALAAFLPAGTDPQLGWNGAGTQQLLDEQVAGITVGTAHTAVVTLLAGCGSKHRESYRDIVMVAIVGPIVALVAVIALGSAVGSF